MKKARSEHAEPSKRSLREIPEVELERYVVRPNRFAMRVKEEGVELVHDAPSAASIAEVPEVDLSAARPRGSARAAATVYLQIGKGRPRRGEEVGATTVRSIRLPDTMWRALASRAAREHVTVHAVLRTALVRYLDATAGGRRATKVAKAPTQRARRAG